MIRSQPHLLSVETAGETPFTMRSAPSSRVPSPNLGREKTPGVSGEAPRGLRPPRAVSLPNCSKAQSSAQAHGAGAVLRAQQGGRGGSAAVPSEGITKASGLAGRSIFAGGRSSSSPCSPPPPPSSSSSSTSPQGSLSPSSSTLHPQLSTSLRHHTSFDSAALARDFFGQHGSVSDPLPRPAGGLDAPLHAAQKPLRKVQRQQTVTSSPLLCRQSAVDGGTQPGVTLSPSLVRRLHVNLPGAQAVSPNSARRFRRQQEVQTPSVESCGSSGDASCSPVSYFRVVVLGDEGVGKSTLMRQMTAGAGACFHRAGKEAGTTEEEDEEDVESVVVDVEKQEEHFTVEIFDSPLDANIDTLRPDTFLVVYSVSDRKSFITATEVTRHLRCELGMDRPVFLVANKTDLRRQQRVTAKEAKDVADTYDCCFVETSAALRVNVDSLLMKVLDHITEQLLPPGESLRLKACTAKQRSTSPGRAFLYVSKLLRHAVLRRSTSSESVRQNR